MELTDAAPHALSPVGKTSWKRHSLPIVLMFLLVITILGTLGIRRATVGEPCQEISWIMKWRGTINGAVIT